MKAAHQIIQNNKQQLFYFITHAVLELVARDLVASIVMCCGGGVSVSGAGTAESKSLPGGFSSSKDVPRRTCQVSSVYNF